MIYRNISTDATASVSKPACILDGLYLTPSSYLSLVGFPAERAVKPIQYLHGYPLSYHIELVSEHSSPKPTILTAESTSTSTCTLRGQRLSLSSYLTLPASLLRTSHAYRREYAHIDPHYPRKAIGIELVSNIAFYKQVVLTAESTLASICTLRG
jgi:hypothetical protein